MSKGGVTRFHPAPAHMQPPPVTQAKQGDIGRFAKEWASARVPSNWQRFKAWLGNGAARRSIGEYEDKISALRQGLLKSLDLRHVQPARQESLLNRHLPSFLRVNQQQASQAIAKLVGEFTLEEHVEALAQTHDGLLISAVKSRFDVPTLQPGAQEILATLRTEFKDRIATALTAQVAKNGVALSTQEANAAIKHLLPSKDLGSKLQAVMQYVDPALQVGDVPKRLTGLMVKFLGQRSDMAFDNFAKRDQLVAAVREMALADTMEIAADRQFTSDAVKQRIQGVRQTERELSEALSRAPDSMLDNLLEGDALGGLLRRFEAYAQP